MCIRRLTPAGRLGLVPKSLYKDRTAIWSSDTTSASAACEMMNAYRVRSARKMSPEARTIPTVREVPSRFQVRPRGLISPGKSASFRTLPMPSSSTIDSELPKLPMIVAMANAPVRRPCGNAIVDSDVLGRSEGARTTVGADEFQHRTGRTTARLDVRDDISLRRPGRRRRGARRGQRRGTTIRQRKNRQSRRVASRSRVPRALTVGRPADGVNHVDSARELGCAAARSHGPDPSMPAAVGDKGDLCPVW